MKFDPKTIEELLQYLNLMNDEYSEAIRRMIGLHMYKDNLDVYLVSMLENEMVSALEEFQRDFIIVEVKETQTITHKELQEK